MLLPSQDIYAASVMVPSWKVDSWTQEWKPDVYVLHMIHLYIQGRKGSLGKGMFLSVPGG
jgi:hypothetical protein